MFSQVFWWCSFKLDYSNISTKAYHVGSSRFLNWVKRFSIAYVDSKSTSLKITYLIHILSFGVFVRNLCTFWMLQLRFSRLYVILSPNFESVMFLQRFSQFFSVMLTAFAVDLFDLLRIWRVMGLHYIRDAPLTSKSFFLFEFRSLNGLLKIKLLLLFFLELDFRVGQHRKGCQSAQMC